MSNIFFCSDHHFGHKNILKFGIRGELFSCIEEHNEALVENHNKVVTKRDTVYFLGDLAFGSASLKYVERMNGNKILIMGNHDKQSMNSYIPIFGANSINGARYFNKLGASAILTHIPVHPMQLEHRFKINIHGHCHEHIIKRRNLLGIRVPDTRYLNVSMEQINFTPIAAEDLLNL